MTTERKGILPAAACAPAILAIHKALTGADPKEKEFFDFSLVLHHENGTKDIAKETIQVTPETIQVANIIFAQYSQLAKLQGLKGK